MTHTNQTLDIEVVSDFACPWCFVGKRRLERALAQRPDIDARVRWSPYQLNPDMPRRSLASCRARPDSRKQAGLGRANLAARHSQGPVTTFQKSMLPPRDRGDAVVCDIADPHSEP